MCRGSIPLDRVELSFFKLQRAGPCSSAQRKKKKKKSAHYDIIISISLVPLQISDSFAILPQEHRGLGAKEFQPLLRGFQQAYLG